MNETIICIKKFNSHLEAQIAEGLLRGAGIMTQLISDDLGGADPLMTEIGPGSIQLLVRSEQVKEARHLLESEES